MIGSGMVTFILSIIIILVSIGFGIARLALPVRGLDFRDTFKDLAHIWVGILIGVACCCGPLVWEQNGSIIFGCFNWHWWMPPIALTALEIFAAIVKKPPMK